MAAVGRLPPDFDPVSGQLSNFLCWQPSLGVIDSCRTSAQNLEVYLAGIDHYPLARQAREALETQSAALAEAEDGANTRRSTGVTGRAVHTKTEVEP
jgi:hypothetical protein